MRINWHRHGWAWAVGVGVAAMGLVGCGLLDLDSFRGITFNLPEKTYRIDSSDSKWDAPAQASLPTVPCGPGGVPTCCEPALASMFGVDCAKHPLTCEGGACAYGFEYEVESIVDLKKEVPELDSSTVDALSEILLKNIKVTLDNDLNMALPPVEIFVAPSDATTAADSRAKKLAQVPGKAAGYSGTETIPLSSEAQQAFSSFATNYKVPFKIFARTKLTLRAGQPAPEGRATAKIGGQVEARL